MAGYNDTRNLIIEALMGRQAGTEIQPEKHQAYALNMLDYVRSVELVSSSTLVGLAEESTVPIQPNQGKVCYIAGVGQDRTVTFSNFIDDDGNPISITTGEMEGVFVILLWNMEHWVAYTFNTNIISSAESANFYYGYNIRKTYASVAAMNADSVNPIGTDGRLIKIGELATVVNSTTPAENGYYSYEGSENGWLLQSGFSFEIVQTTGTDVNRPMSQKAVTDELALKVDKTALSSYSNLFYNNIKNGDFIDGSSDWVLSPNHEIVLDEELQQYVIRNIENTSITRSYQIVSAKSGDKLYISVYGKSNQYSPTITNIAFSPWNNLSVFYRMPVNNTAYSYVSNILTIPVGVDDIRVYFETLVGANAAATKFLLLNLTQIYGVGNEPDVSYMNTLLGLAGNYFNVLDTIKLNFDTIKLNFDTIKSDIANKFIENPLFSIFGYLSTNGEVIGGGSEIIVTDFEVYNGGDIVVSGYCSSTTRILFFYDRYFQPISGYDAGIGVKNNLVVPQSSIPQGTVFVRAYARSADNNANLTLHKEVGDLIKTKSDYINEVLLLDQLDGTNNTPTIINGVLSKIEHKDSSNRLIRKDDFVFSDSQIIETRTFMSVSKTITTDLLTLKTTIQ